MLRPYQNLVGQVLAHRLRRNLVDDELASMGHSVERLHVGYPVQAICEELRHRQVRKLAQEQRRATWVIAVLAAGTLAISIVELAS